MQGPLELFPLTRTLIDIESVTPDELAVGQFLASYLEQLAQRHEGRVERLEVEPKRYNVLATFGNPAVTLSTHQDTVPPFIPSREDGDFIHGRGACDVKGIIASMIKAAEGLLEAGTRNFALLCSGRGAQLGRRVRGFQGSARLAFSDQRRAHRKQAGAGQQRSAAL
jgi:acetylornithine deacetylase